MKEQWEDRDKEDSEEESVVSGIDEEGEKKKGISAKMRCLKMNGKTKDRNQFGVIRGVYRIRWIHLHMRSTPTETVKVSG